MLMDVVYDIVEAVHFFIPLVAVAVIVVTIYFCGSKSNENHPIDATAHESASTLKEDEDRKKED
ncbi:hypothetical protein AB6A40_006535 [Gnathostoma spinigerum]|uniref:Uncharacterized protein n=1 Tax=Gnathostoma spinigerum TaxID=75299 RepID=A0ABD6EQW0_9BILA